MTEKHGEDPNGAAFGGSDGVFGDPGHDTRSRPTPDGGLRALGDDAALFGVPWAGRLPVLGEPAPDGGAYEDEEGCRSRGGGASKGTRGRTTRARCRARCRARRSGLYEELGAGPEEERAEEWQDRAARAEEGSS